MMPPEKELQAKGIDRDEWLLENVCHKDADELTKDVRDYFDPDLFADLVVYAEKMGALKFDQSIGKYGSRVGADWKPGPQPQPEPEIRVVFRGKATRQNPETIEQAVEA